MRSVLTRHQRVANQLPAALWHEDHSAGDHRPAPINAWDATQLKRLFHSTLRDEQVIVVSNRAPVAHVWLDGRAVATQPSSGLVTALEPVVRACNGTWNAYGGGEADREMVDDADLWRVGADGNAYGLRRIWLSDAERAGYINGMSNAGLWPLCHRVAVKPLFLATDWAHYCTVNRRFAEAIEQESRRPDPFVLVQDFHLALVPALVRERLPRATIVSFWHVPWGSPLQMARCPWLETLVGGLLGSDIVGFQTPRHQRNFVESASRYGINVGTVESLPSETAQSTGARAKCYPISIAWPTPAELLAQPSAADCRRDIFLRWSIAPHGKLIVGVDRFDYTKGLPERLLAIERLLLDYPAWRGRVSFIQVAVPTRESLQDYAALRAHVTSEVIRINSRFGDGRSAPVILLDVHHERQQLEILYRAADVCLVTSLDDGMNLVAKEFVAARQDERGVLVLSRYVGAAQQLAAALIVNPYQADAVAQALHRSLSMPVGEQRLRMRSLRRTVEVGNVHQWAAHMLLDAAILRSAKASAARPADGAVLVART